MVLPRRRPLDDESKRLQPVFHAMDPATAGPRYGKLFSTVWKTYGQAAARAIRYPDLRARNPAPGFMINKEQNKGLHRTAHKLRQLHAFAMINPVAASTYCACAPSGEA